MSWGNEYLIDTHLDYYKSDFDYLLKMGVLSFNDVNNWYKKGLITADEYKYAIDYMQE